MSSASSGGPGRDGSGDRRTKPRSEKRQKPAAKVCPFCRKTDAGHFPVDCPEVKCYSCNEKGHLRDVCTNPECSWCGERGHRKRDCPRRQQTAPKRKAPAAETAAPQSDSETGSQSQAPARPVSSTLSYSAVAGPSQPKRPANHSSHSFSGGVSKLNEALRHLCLHLSRDDPEGDREG